MEDAEWWPASDNFSWQSDIYEFRVEGVEGCELPAPKKKGKKEQKLNLMKPLKHKKCKNILADAWKHCDNAGRGGSLQAGCLRYSIHTRF